MGRPRSAKVLNLYITIGGATLPSIGTLNIGGIGALFLWPLGLKLIRDNTKVSLLIALSLISSSAVVLSYLNSPGSPSGVMQDIVIPMILCAEVVTFLHLRTSPDGYKPMSYVGIPLAVLTGTLTESAFRGSSLDWKFGVGQSVFMFLCLFAALLSQRGKSKLAAMLLFLSCLGNLFLEARLLSFLSFTAAILVLSFGTNRSIGRGWRASAIIGVATLAAWVAYSASASQGFLGENQYAKFTSQTDRGIASFIFAARPELIPSFFEAIRHPIIGLGPLSNVTTTEALGVISQVDRFTDLNPALVSYLVTGGLHTHSIILHASIVGGLFAALPWAYIVLQNIRYLVALGRETQVELPVGFAWVLLSTWEVLFSPLTATSIVIVAAGLLYSFNPPKLALQDTPRIEVVSG